MSDMHGAVRSNWFIVKDPEAFRAWFNDETNVHFGNEIKLWEEPLDWDEPDQPDRLTRKRKFAFGGYEDYPCAYPRFRAAPTEEDEFPDVPEWDLEAFADAIRLHLAPGQEFRVLACGDHKLRYTEAQRLFIDHSTATFENWYEGD